MLLCDCFMICLFVLNKYEFFQYREIKLNHKMLSPVSLHPQSSGLDSSGDSRHSYWCYMASPADHISPLLSVKPLNVLRPLAQDPMYVPPLQGGASLQAKSPVPPGKATLSPRHLILASQPGSITQHLETSFIVIIVDR